jgi:hypothetical protein
MNEFSVIKRHPRVRLPDQLVARIASLLDGVAMSMDAVSGPSEDIKTSWRAACLAYRRERQAGKGDYTAFQAALSAFRELRPNVQTRAAHDETRRAIVWASVEHKEWFWCGVGGR